MIIANFKKESVGASVTIDDGSNSPSTISILGPVTLIPSPGYGFVIEGQGIPVLQFLFIAYTIKIEGVVQANDANAICNSLRAAVMPTTDNTAPLNSQTGAYTGALTDAGKLVEMSNASPVDYTVPPYSSVAYGLNTRIEVVQGGVGQVTVKPGAGVTLLSADGALKTRVQYSVLTLVNKAQDVWYVFGDAVL